MSDAICTIPEKMAAMGRVRASAHQATTLWVARACGDDAVEQIYRRIPPGQAELLRAVHAGDWCPLAAYAQYMAAVDRVFGQGDLQLARTIGEASAHWQLPALLRAVLNLMSPLQALRYIPGVWRKMYDAGRVEIERTGDATVLWRLHDFAPFHRIVCERIAGFATAGIEMTGGHAPHVEHTQCVTSGDPVCEYALSWQPREP